MKTIILSQFIFLMSSFVLYCAELISEFSGKFTESEIIMSDKSKVSTFRTEGTFKNNIGRYGSFVCLGFIEKMKNGQIKNLLNICESTDQYGNKIWSRGKRSKSNIRAGVGRSYIVDSTNKNRDLLIGTECKYAVNYLRNLSFSKSICKISNENYERLKND